ncbi:hypothetical protein [Streptomyces sp. NPDC059003]
MPSAEVDTISSTNDLSKGLILTGEDGTEFRVIERARNASTS